MRYLLLWSLAFGTLLSSPARGAILFNAHLVPSGSEYPKGDRIDLNLMLEPKEVSIEIEVRGFTVGPKATDDSLAMAVEADGEKYSDEQGFHRVLFRVKRDPKVKTGIPCPVRFKAVVPFSSIKLEPGEERNLGYVVRGIKNRGVEEPLVAFSRPTSMATVTLSPAERVVSVPQIEAIDVESVRRTLTKQKTKIVSPVFSTTNIDFHEFWEDVQH